MKSTQEKINLGSATARNGFCNEREIADKFNNWSGDTEARLWLQIMGYNLEEIELVKAVVISGHKADINVQITIKLREAIDVENLQVKLVSNNSGFNQVDKRWLSSYIDMWNIPPTVADTLKYFTGEIPPSKATRDSRRMFVNEFSIDEQKELLSFLDENKVMIISDILRGRGEFCAEWVLVAQKVKSNARWILKNINEVINYYFGDGEVKISPRGSINIGKVLMQRKGGDRGRPTANMLQFKINPIELFEIGEQRGISTRK